MRIGFLPSNSAAKEWWAAAGIASEPTLATRIINLDLILCLAACMMQLSFLPESIRRSTSGSWSVGAAPQLMRLYRRKYCKTPAMDESCSPLQNAAEWAGRNGAPISQLSLHDSKPIRRL